MAGPLIAIVGDANPNRVFDPPMKNAAKAKKAAFELGTELAKHHARLLVYGGPYLGADVVEGFVAGKPAEDHCIVMWYSKDYEPPPFPRSRTTQTSLSVVPKGELTGRLHSTAQLPELME